MPQTIMSCIVSPNNQLEKWQFCRGTAWGLEPHCPSFVQLLGGSEGPKVYPKPSCPPESDKGPNEGGVEEKDLGRQAISSSRRGIS